MTVSLTIDQHVARVTLARPAALNAVDLATEAELQRIWTELEQNRDVRVIVLTGEGERAFCVGADLKNPSTSGLEYWAAPRPGGFVLRLRRFRANGIDVNRPLTLASRSEPPELGMAATIRAEAFLRINERGQFVANVLLRP